MTPTHTPTQSALTVIAEAFAPLAGKRILDIGCGRGALAAPLAAAGAAWQGVDPAPPPDAPAAVDRGGAEALPYPAASFDGAIFLNALHHVPPALMDRALAEAGRVLRPAGLVLVIEPLATGALAEVLRIVDDETEQRAAAQEAVLRATRRPAFHLRETFDYLRAERYTGFQQFAERIAAADPARAPVIAARRAALAAAFAAHAEVWPDPGGDPARRRLVLTQPMRAHVLAPGAPPP